jgi:DNA polymerase-4
LRALLADATPVIERCGITLLGISVANLDDDDIQQLTLPFDAYSDGALDLALDRVRAKFGSGSVTRAVLANREPGVTMPLLPD